MQHNILVRTIGVSAFLHALVLVMVMTVDLPPPPSQADYSEWVKRIATPPREAVLAPVEEGYKSLPEAKKTEEVKPEETAGGGGAAKGVSAAKGGGGGGGGGVKQAAVRASVSGKGVLGVIGVASGGGGEFEDVFSSSSGGVSGDLEGAMAGKRSVALPGAGSGLGRKRVGGEGDGSGEGGGSGTADIGGVGVGAGGSVESNKRRQAELTAPQVSGSEADLLAGNIDRKGVSSIIARKKAGFQRCYERGLKMDIHLRGKLVFELTIGEEGNVVEVRFLEDTLKSKEVSDCVKGILTRLILPKPQGALATIKNTLAFEPPQ